MNRFRGQKVCLLRDVWTPIGCTSVRKPLSLANKCCILIQCNLIVAEEEGTANSVPAAAVIQRSRALFGFTGRKGCVGGWLSLR